MSTDGGGGSSSRKDKDNEKSKHSKYKENKDKPKTVDKDKQKTEHQTKGFLCKPAFHNVLPTAPSGPFFRPLGLHKDKNDMLQFATYQVSTLEKSCIWQPHYGPELGLRLDLVDQESIIPTDTNNGKNVIDANEIRYLTESRVRANKRHYDEQPWWLRHTTSNLGTDITAKDITRGKNEENRKDIEIVNIFDPKEIEKSFVDVEKKVKSLTVSNKRVKPNENSQSSSEIQWAIPLLPDENNATSIFSLMKFDEDPTKLIDNSSSSSSSSNSGSGNNSRHIGRRIEKCIITNYRPTEKRGSFVSSLIIPQENGTDLCENDENTNGDKKYIHISDFNMNVKKKEMGLGDFMIVVNDDGSGPKVASFTPLGALIDMKKTAQTKIKNEDGTIVEKVHNFYVRRRK